jgi:hypothetical protein
MREKIDTVFFLRPFKSYRLRSQILIFFFLTCTIILVLAIVILKQYKSFIDAIFIDCAKKSFLISTHNVFHKSSMDFEEFISHL